MTSVLISAQELRELLDSAAAPRLLDVRWSLAQPDGTDAYRAGHLPGAVYVDLDTELAGHGTPQDGRHPLPSIPALQASARGWGIRTGEPVVVYDDSASQAAARAWWLLTYAGLPEVRILDGGIAAWLDAGGSLVTDVPVPELGDVELSGGHLPAIDIDQAAAWPDNGVLLDARARERYLGQVEPVDPRAGHIPGAISAPTGGNVDEAGRFLPAATLRERFADLGIDTETPLAVYCGSGVTAAHEIAALTIAGLAPALYPGSWSAWSNRPERPVETADRSVVARQP